MAEFLLGKGYEVHGIKRWASLFNTDRIDHLYKDPHERNPRLNKSSRIFVAGHRGLVGTAIVRKLRNDGYDNLLLWDRRELDLTSQAAVQRFFADEKPEYVFLAAARSAGFMRTTRIRPISFATTCRSRSMLSRRHIGTV